MTKCLRIHKLLPLRAIAVFAVGICSHAVGNCLRTMKQSKTPYLLRALQEAYVLILTGTELHFSKRLFGIVKRISSVNV